MKRSSRPLDHLIIRQHERLGPSKSASYRGVFYQHKVSAFSRLSANVKAETSLETMLVVIDSYSNSVRQLTRRQFASREKQLAQE